MLSVAMVVKNEVLTIEETIKSIRDHADEIVIGVDSESSDGTLDIAKRLGDKVITIYLSEELDKKGPKNEGDTEWGFSRARNIVLDACDQSNWHLTLDGHEKVVRPEEVKGAVEEAIEKGHDGIETMILFEPDASGIPRQMYRQSRVFAPTVRYNNPLHNVPIVKSSMFSKLFKIEHRKQDQAIESKSDRDAQRSDSTINGFLQEIEKNPGNSRSWFYLGNAYKENARWQEAIDAYTHYLTIAVWKEERWHARVNMGVCYDRTGDPVNTREQYVKALDEFHGMAEVYCSLGELAYKQERFIEAQVWLEACIDMPVPECRLFVNPRVYLVDRYDKLSMTYNHLGRYQDAADMAERALESVQDSRIANNVKCWKKALSKR